MPEYPGVQLLEIISRFLKLHLHARDAHAAQSADVYTIYQKAILIEAEMELWAQAVPKDWMFERVCPLFFLASIMHV